MKSSSLRLSIALAALMLVSLACTLPFAITPVEPEEKIVYVEVTSTPLPAEAPTAAPQAAPTSMPATPPVSVNFEGAWVIWQGSSEQQLNLDFLQTGYNLIANAATGSGDSLLFKGTISQDGKSVTGTWESTSGTSGSFLMAMDAALTAFSGNLGGGVPFCGSRSGTKPAPCIK